MPPRLMRVFQQAYADLKSGKLKTLIPFLSLLRANGKPLTLKMHYQFAPLFGCVQPAKTIMMTARQVGKSWCICENMILRSMLIPFYHTILIQPRADQIQRMIGTIYKPILNSCPVVDLFINNVERQKLALREFRNGSLCYAENMYQNPDRVRGVGNVATCCFDEAQDIEYEFLDIAAEVMSASLFWGFSIYTGTPKTTDTTHALLWNRSSQAEWVIRCDHCNYFNVPNPEHDLLKMVGKSGPICAHCGKPVYPHNGGYVHAIPDRMHSFPGYHISQPIHPLHMLNINKWGKLLDKFDTYTEMTLYNEVLGWPYDAATSPLTLSDLQKASNPPEVNSIEDFEKIADRYSYVTVAVDWSGGGMLSDSYTAIAVLGLRRHPADVIDVIYGKRLPKGMTPTDEAREILDWIKGTGADAFAYDNGGAGFARLEIMNHEGLQENPGLTIVPINYVRPHSGDVMIQRPAQREPDMTYYTLDKSRSLAICIMALKAGRLRVPEFNESDETAYQRDFLALREDPRVSLGNETVILIIKKPGVPDDFAHAVNFGASQIWDHFGAYPRIGTKYDASVLDYDENHNKIMDDEVFGPRGDFDRFRNAVESRAASLVEPQDWFSDSEW